MKNEGRYGNRSQTQSWGVGMQEPTQPDQPDTRGGYPGQDDRVGSFDSYDGAPIPTLRVRRVPKTNGIKEFVALRDRPVEQKMDAVMGLYPLYMWDESLDVMNNWLSAAALDQGCGTQDVMDAAKIQSKQKGDSGQNMRRWLQMLKESK